MDASMFPFLEWILGVNLPRMEMTGGENSGCGVTLEAVFCPRRLSRRLVELKSQTSAH